MIQQIRDEIYDENGLVEVIFHTVNEPTQEELIAEIKVLVEEVVPDELGK